MTSHTMTSAVALAEARKIVRRAGHILTSLGDDAFTARMTAHRPGLPVPAGTGHGRHHQPMKPHRGQLLP
jgi:hypothetical protein